jgi:uncharacterized protein (DUF1499 family)
MAFIRTFVFLVVLLTAILVLAGFTGMLAGKEPRDLGVKDGRLKPPSFTRNSVSSQASLYPDHPQRAYADIAPFPVQGTGTESLSRLLALLTATRGVTVVQSDSHYVYAQCRTKFLRFTDDLEFWLDDAAQVIHVRSASRLGREDFGVNRQRIEALRAAYLAPRLGS